MYNYIERITEPIIDFKEELSPLLENIDEVNMHTLLKSLEISVSNGWVGEASELSDSLLNSEIVQSNPKVLINVHLERMKKYQYFELYTLARQSSLKVLKLLEENSGCIDKNLFDLWKFTAIAQLGWIEKDIQKLEQVIEQGKSVCIQSSDENKSIMEAFLAGLTGKKYLMNKSTELGKEYFNRSINQLKKLNYFRAVAHLKIYFAENLFEYSSKHDSYQLAVEILNENEINKFKSHLVLRIYCLLIKSNLEESEKKQKHILSLQVLMYAMGLGQSQKIYPFVKSAFELIPESKTIDFFNINFKIWLGQTINDMSGEEYESLLVTYFKDRGYFFVDKLAGQFPVFDIIAKAHFDGNELVTLIQAKHWKTNVVQGTIPDGKRFEEAYDALKERYNFTTVNFVKYYCLTGITNEAVKTIEYNACTNKNPNVKVDTITGNDEIINFYLKNPGSIMNLFVKNFK